MSGRVVLRARLCALVSIAVSAFAFPAMAGAPAIPPHIQTPSISLASDPFGMRTASLTDGGIVAKWQGASRAIEADVETIRNCRADRAACTSPAALRLIAIADQARARDGLARLGEVNRAVNLAIRQLSDQAQYGAADYWSAPLMTLTSGAGDCEDYAILKMAVLRDAGIAAADLRLVIVRDLQFNDDHAVLAVRFDGRWRILDNRRLIMIEDTDMQRTLPLFVLDETGARRFGEPELMIAEQKRDAPAVDAEMTAAPAGIASETTAVASFDDRFVFAVF